MRGVFDDKELEPAQAKRDTELTLGAGTLLAIFFGLVLLCGLCFGLGYTVGHHSGQPSMAANTPTSAAPQPIDSSSSTAKPPATTQAAPTPSAPDATDAEETAQAAVDPSGSAPTAAAETLPAPVQASTAPSQPLVHTALPPASPATQPGQPATAANPRATLTPVAAPASAGVLMVQIAAVSNAEDAEVLTNALRKRGYAVSAHRDPADNLIHVRIGPFTTVAEANNWKMKLLNDGYNAIMQP